LQLIALWRSSGKVIWQGAMFEDGGDSHEPDCAGKQKFSNRRQARDIAMRRSLTGKKGDAYRCPSVASGTSAGGTSGNGSDRPRSEKETLKCRN
jgi:hypothetical protein